MRIPLASMAALAAALSCAAPAAAQDEDKSFQGFHVEGVIGWDDMDNGSTVSGSKDDAVYGGAIGYDFQSGHLVFGLDTELTGTGVESTLGSVNSPGDTLLLEAGRDIYVGGRIGYAFTPHLLGYAKVGYTNLHMQATYDPHNLGGSIIEADSNADGYRLGAGIEYAFSGGFYAKAEYRYSSYGDVDQFSINLDRSQIVAGVGFRF